VLTLTNDAASLRVKGGALYIFDEGRLIRYEPGAVTPDAIVLAGWNGALTMSAVRFCAEHKIALVFLDWLNGLMSFVASEPKAAAALVRAQVNANPVPIAREIVALKIEHCRMVGCLTPGEARSLIAAVRRARSTPEIMNCEATAAKLNFDRRQCELKPRGGPLPVAWRRFTQRSASPNSYSPRRAKHPINAMLNVNYSIVAGRLAAQLSARGTCLSIGFLHADKKNRFSLVYDAIEPLRPLIEAKTFAFVAKRKFSRADFFRLSDGEVRIAPNLLKVLTQETALPESDIQGASDFVVSLIQRRRAR
jgi:CRISPR-associated protein Cas1